MIEYEKYEKMVKKVAWNWAKNYSEYEENFAELNLEFVKACISYDPARCQFGTYLFSCLNNRMKVVKTKWQPKTGELNDYIPAATPNTEKLLGFKETLSNLSNDAQEIIALVLEMPAEFYEWLAGSIKLNRRMITDYMRNVRCWKYHRIWDAFNEIEAAIN